MGPSASSLIQPPCTLVMHLRSIRVSLRCPAELSAAWRAGNAAVIRCRIRGSRLSLNNSRTSDRAKIDVFRRRIRNDAIPPHLLFTSSPVSLSRRLSSLLRSIIDRPPRSRVNKNRTQETCSANLSSDYLEAGIRAIIPRVADRGEVTAMHPRSWVDGGVGGVGSEGKAAPVAGGN